MAQCYTVGYLQVTMGNGCKAKTAKDDDGKIARCASSTGTQRFDAG